MASNRGGVAQLVRARGSYPRCPGFKSLHRHQLPGWRRIGRESVRALDDRRATGPSRAAGRAARRRDARGRACPAGADSVALPRRPGQPARRGDGFRVVAAHLDHGLRAGLGGGRGLLRRAVPRAWASRFARGPGRRAGAGPARAAAGLEEAARRERYAFLREVQGSGRRRAPSPWPTPATTRRRRSCCACCAGRARRASAPCARVAGDVLRPLLGGLARGTCSRHLRGARPGAGARTRPTPTRVPAQPRRATSCCPYLEWRFNPRVRADPGPRGRRVLADEAAVLGEAAGRAGRARRPRGDGGAVLLDRVRPRLRRRGPWPGPPSASRAGARRAACAAWASCTSRPLLALAAAARPSGRRLPLPGGREAVVDFDELRIGPRRTPAEAFALDAPRPRPRGSPRTGLALRGADRDAGPAVSNGVTRGGGRAGRAADRADAAAGRPRPRQGPRDEPQELPDGAAGPRRRAGGPAPRGRGHAACLWVPGLELEEEDGARRYVQRAPRGRTPMMAKPEVLFSQQDRSRSAWPRSAPRSTRAFEGREVCVVGLMKSCLVFMADLIRAMPLDMTCHFLRVVVAARAGGRGHPAHRHRLLDGHPLRGPGHPAPGRHRGHRDHPELPAGPHPRAPAAEPEGLRAHRQAGRAQDRRPARLGGVHPATSRARTTASSWATASTTRSATAGCRTSEPFPGRRRTGARSRPRQGISGSSRGPGGPEQ